MKRLIVTALLSLHVLFAHDVITTKITWSREISRIVLAKCASCHQPGGSAFSLTTYQEVRPWAVAIKEEILERRMPPFGAVKGFGELADDQSLMQEQMELISAWVEGGAPEGDPALLPKQVDQHATPQKPPTGPKITVDGVFTLPGSLSLLGIQPASLREGSSIRVIAQSPDGAITPLVWIYQFRQQFAQTYYFKHPLAFVAGTAIRVFPRNAGTVALLPALTNGSIVARRR